MHRPTWGNRRERRPARAFEAELRTAGTAERPRLLALMGVVHGCRRRPRDPADEADRELDLAQLDAARLSARLVVSTAGIAGAGDTVVLDFGDGPETFRLGALDHGDGVPTINP